MNILNKDMKLTGYFFLMIFCYPKKKLTCRRPVHLSIAVIKLSARQPWGYNNIKLVLEKK